MQLLKLEKRREEKHEICPLPLTRTQIGQQTATWGVHLMSWRNEKKQLKNSHLSTSLLISVFKQQVSHRATLNKQMEMILPYQLSHLFTGIIPTSVQMEKSKYNQTMLNYIHFKSSRCCYWKMSLCLTYAWLSVTQSSSSWWDWWPPHGYRRKWSIHWCAQSHHQPINPHRMGY